MRMMSSLSQTIRSQTVNEEKLGLVTSKLKAKS